MVPPTGVDPAAFKLSAAETFHAGGKYETLQLGYGNFLGTYSVDVCQALVAKCGEPSYAYNYQCTSTSVAEDETYYHEVAKFEHLTPGAHPNELVATLARPIGSGDELPQAPSGACGDLFLHYAAGARAVQDADGHPLQSIAPRFVCTPGTP